MVIDGIYVLIGRVLGMEPLVTCFAFKLRRLVPFIIHMLAG